MGINDLRNKRKIISDNARSTLNSMKAIADESNRVAEVAHKSTEILDELDREFESQTGLKKVDIAFLFVAIALQCGRIFLVNNLSKIERAGQGNRNEGFIHDIQDKILREFDNGDILNTRPYYAPLNHIITNRGVPYDATGYFDEKYDLFKGANHRFATLGHDPILGLIFGTANILTNTITCIKTPLITTNHVVYDVNMKNPRIAGFSSTAIMLQRAASRLDGDVSSVVAAIIKQILHIGTDMYTPYGIQLPGANLILSNTNVEKLTRYIGTGDIIKVGASAGLAILINTIISTLHLLMHDETICSYDAYDVRTRKIILYSNVIASSSNIIWVGANAVLGNETAIKDLDIGGVIVTIQRLLTDVNYIRQVKEEFVFGGFIKMIHESDTNF